MNSKNPMAPLAFALMASVSTAFAFAAGTCLMLAAPVPGAGAVDGLGSAARFHTPSGIAVDGAGNVYVAEVGNHTIRKISSAGEVTTLAGLAQDSDGNGCNDGGYADGNGNAARFNMPSGLAIDAAGNLYVADTGNSIIRKITPRGEVTTFAGTAGETGSVDGTGSAARFNRPEGVAVDREGNVYVGDTGNATIRMIHPAGEVTTLAGLAGKGGSADGASSTARFGVPCGVAVDGAGNLLVADPGTHTIRKVAPGGVVTTLAGQSQDSNGDGYYDGGYADGNGSEARFCWPYAVAVNAAGYVFVTDGLNDTIRMIDPAGIVSTLAGLAHVRGSADGVGTTAQFRLHTGSFFPCIWAGLGVDSTGNIYVADAGNHSIRRISSSAVVTTLAGLALEPPRITRQPRSRSALLGATVVFDVVAEETAPLSYQWRFGNRHLDGATNASLTVSNLNLSDLGEYLVYVRNAAGETTSQPAWLKLARWNELVVFDASISFQDSSNGKSWVEWFGERACLTGPGQIKSRATGGATGADVRSQITSYLRSYTPGPNTLIAPWFAGISADLAWNYKSVDFVVSNYLANLSQLAQGGGKVFLLPNLVPLWWNPIMDNAYARSIDYAEVNARLDRGIAQLQADHSLTIHRFDFWGLCSNLLAHPVAYGFTNVTDAANRFCPPGDANKFLWWDGAHPTTAFHRVISDETYRCLTPPLVLSVPIRNADGSWSLHWQGGFGPFRLEFCGDELLNGSWGSIEPFTEDTTASLNLWPSERRFFRVLQLGQ